MDTAEPSAATYESIGRLCAAWAYLEGHTEKTVWGILDANARIGPIITWRLDLRGRWQLILQQAPKKHGEEDMKTLRALNKEVETVARDRNIIVHGLVTALIEVPRQTKVEYGVVFARESDPGLTFHRPPSWTVFRGAEAGKFFPISTNAVEVVRRNIDVVTNKVIGFNKVHGYMAESLPEGAPEADWPKPLERSP